MTRNRGCIFFIQVNIWMFLDKIRKEYQARLRYNEGYKK